jgi:hypothetical protein
MKLNWGQSIFLFFVVFISLAIAFIIFSLRQNNDLVTDNYYEKGAAYSNQMEINGRSVVYNDSIQLINQNNIIVVRFSKSIDRMADTVYISFFRPSDKMFDCNFICPLATDSLEIEKSKLAKGRYKVKFRWGYGGDSYMTEKEFFIE